MLNGISIHDGLKLRKAKQRDRAFMQQLFNSTREHLRLLPLTGPQIEALFAQQYQLQQTYYAGQWPDASTLIIQLGSNAIGKIIIDENQTALHIIDIALEPAMRGKGYGTALLRAIQAAAQKRGLPVRLSVDRQNRQAKKLYLALGFQVTGTSDTHESMSWSPSLPGASGDFFTHNRNNEPVKSVFRTNKGGSM
ncbi:MAG TPA: GNAT family N-acetyltransferase [Gammaproteobacteria bacterium]